MRRERREEERRRQEEFKKLQRFIGCRNRMCRIVRIGRRQRFAQAKRELHKKFVELSKDREQEEKMGQKVRVWADEFREY